MGSLLWVILGLGGLYLLVRLSFKLLLWRPRAK